MARANAFIGWIGMGTGVVLIGAAIKNKNPVQLVKNALAGNPADAAEIQTGINLIPVLGSVVGSSSSGSSRATQLANHQIQPDLVPIGSQPFLKLDREAAASFANVEAAYGRKIILSNSWRSFAEQASAYARDPLHFAQAGHSLHEVGLAVDVSTTAMNVNDPKLVAAFTANGWFRQGKKINGKPEEWHWSYGVPG